MQEKLRIESAGREKEARLKLTSKGTSWFTKWRPQFVEPNFWVVDAGSVALSKFEVVRSLRCNFGYQVKSVCLILSWCLPSCSSELVSCQGGVVLSREMKYSELDDDWERR